MKEKTEIGEIERHFADENARVAWEMSQAVARILPSLPTEEINMELEPIQFSQEDKRRGLHAIFTAGPVVGTGTESLLVPKRTLKILDTLKIPYQLPVG